jgi:hypothetical protein
MGPGFESQRDHRGLKDDHWFFKEKAHLGALFLFLSGFYRNNYKKEGHNKSG